MGECDYAGWFRPRGWSLDSASDILLLTRRIQLGDLTVDQVLHCDTTSPMLLRRHQAIADYLGYTSNQE
jgi:hypothetical protein